MRRPSRHLGIRLRSTLAAIAVVAVALAVGGIAFVYLYERALAANADADALGRARDVAGQIATGGLASLERPLPTGPGDQSLLQVVGPAGVVAASGSIAREPPMSPLRAAPDQVLRENRRLAIADQDTFRITAVGVADHGTRYTVLAGQSLHTLSDSLGTLSTLLVAGYPVLLLVIGGATFWFVGRSLRPVEEIRRRVAGITARDLHARVPVPDTRDEVARLAETMNDMLDRLERSAADQRRFVADASHELRSPLSTVQAGVELMRASPEPPSDAELAMLHDETRRLARLIGELLLLARADERGLSPRYEDVDLDDLLDAERRRLAQDERVTVSASIAAVRVRGDRHQLGQAVRNLADNAVRHASARVTLLLAERDGSAVIDVGDDGPGIPPADRERIFGRFVRLDDSRHRSGGGSGLGLAIVREIVLAHGGSVRVLPSGPGTTFRVTLPVQGA
ncbi:MAG TPA: HAMP domain-containing sensor histidine kinase [Mycobacteriales bacterium]|jgi:signal transduction histidine kinase